MRLKSIKLAGFKSFVDPTTLKIPSNLIGVVGPNGCGKSNIIDAVRWVMGESSAKHLRGDSMADVIFNGSSKRKPVSTATVELIFDNSDGKAGGEYAQYAEIGVKRQVSRDGLSAYFLNGTKCRRRDITDIFLGTGIGPRGYSIIEQGMISQIVEAKPEELRQHLEEAAGISKYKERRRETEHRIRHTRENLERLEDLRIEVGKHLDRLDRQARQAERYKLLKAEQRRKDAEWHALQWRTLDQELQQRKQRLAQMNAELEKSIARLRSFESDTESERENLSNAQESVNTIQAEMYRIGAEIARLEQGIAHRKDMQSRQQRALSEAERDQQELTSHIDLDRAHLAELQRDIEKSEPELELARQHESTETDRLAQLEEQTETMRATWEDFSSRSGQVSREAEVERTRIEALDRNLQDRARRIEKLRAERANLKTEEIESALQRLRGEREQTAEQQTQAEARHDEVRARLSDAIAGLRSQRERANELGARHRQLQGRKSSLETLQQAALGDHSESLRLWLKDNGLAGAQRLAQVIEVETGYEKAVEAALGDLLEAVVVEDPWMLVEKAGIPEGGVCLVSSAAGPKPGSGLGARVNGPLAVHQLLERCDTEESAEIHVRDDGVLGTPHWLRARGTSPTSGVIERERELRELEDSEVELAEQLKACNESVAQMESAVSELESQRDGTQEEINRLLRRGAELEGQVKSREAQLAAVQQRFVGIDREIAEQGERLEGDEGTIRKARSRLESSVESMAGLEEERASLESNRRELSEQYEQARRVAREAQQKVQQMTIALESKRSAVRSTQQSLQRTETQLKSLADRRAELMSQIETLSNPIGEEEKALKDQLQRRLEVEEKLRDARTKADEIAEKLRHIDSGRQQIDAEIQRRREALAEERVNQEGLRVKAQGLVEHLDDTEFEREALLSELTEDATADAWRAAVEELEQKIRRLEPVNLAAIEEFKTEQERKQYLDAQNDDLVQALETLEDAIAKIDRQTRTRFKETFDKVNKGVQVLFPRLFGGGHAYLDLTGDDLLSTGVAIMARPPGKRVTNIHLLSGGEKALTAVSVVFSIFQLNPAPFCMLDEVDAPLDDANVGRFSELVREMSEQVQFLFVSHNKITMEIAHQLMGVTMREPGVSRLVSVDVAEAARMAAE